jgi:hypothetical protein
MTAPKRYRLIGADGIPYSSAEKGTLGGYNRVGNDRLYGQLDCQNALRWIAKGNYAKWRVFFADEQTAIAAGFRPCAKCMRAEYRAWKARRP